MIKKLLKQTWKFKFIIPIILIYITNFFIARYIIKLIVELIKKENFKIISLNAESSFFFIMLFALYLTFLCHIPHLIKLFLRHKDIFYDNELKVLYWCMITIPLGIIGSLFSFYVVINMVLPFFMAFNDFLGLERVIGFSQLIQLIVIQGLAFFMFFQIPVILKLLITLNIFSKEQLKSKNIRLIYLIFILIISSWITPPDPISLLTVALPLYLCYEIGIRI